MLSGRRRFLLGSLALVSCREALALAQPDPPRLSARHAYVGNLRETLLAVAAETPVPIASVSKLVTALVILSAELPPDEKIRIDAADVAASGHTASGVAVGTTWRREQLLEWLLVASDNRAAAALARTFPGGWPEFQYAMRALLTQMQLFSFDFGDSSGLSAFNKASARDLGVLLVLLSQWPWFRNLAKKPSVGSKMNVNRFAHDRSVALLAGKTGFTAAAGYCLAMAEQFDDQVYALVVLNARDREARAQDMNALRRFTRQTLVGHSDTADGR
jgi:serine-type D-Ala-D-Ala endopeptidase (penicillin-binding protein 7)